MKMNLQYFAEETETEEVTAEPEQVEEESAEEASKKYSDEDVNEIVNKKFAKWQKELEAKEKEKEEAVEEAKRLAKMNQQEKEKYEFDKMKEELESYKKQQQYYELSKEASKMLAEHDIQADDDLLQFVVKDNADATKTSVNAFVELVNAKVEQGVKKALSGSSPKVNTNAHEQQSFTMDDLKNMNREEINKNWEQISKIKR